MHISASSHTIQRYWATVGAVVRSRRFLLALLASQYVLVQLITAPLYGDAPRNLHWGILTAERPSFLFGDTDPYAFVKGFAPDPPSLAPQGMYRNMV